MFASVRSCYGDWAPDQVEQKIAAYGSEV